MCVMSCSHSPRLFPPKHAPHPPPGQILIGSCVLPPKNIRDQAESLQRTNPLPGDSLSVIEALVAHFVDDDRGAPSACPNVLSVLATVASWLGCNEVAPLLMLLHGVSAQVVMGNITARDALARMCGLLHASSFDANDSPPLPVKEQRLVEGMWMGGVCVMFENLSHRSHGIEFSLFYNPETISSSAAAAAAAAAQSSWSSQATWLDNVVQMIQFYNQVSALISHHSARAVTVASRNSSPAAAAAPASPSQDPLSPSPAVSKVLDLLKQV